MDHRPSWSWTTYWTRLIQSRTFHLESQQITHWTRSGSKYWWCHFAVLPGIRLEGPKNTVKSLSTVGLQVWTGTWYIMNTRQECFPQDHDLLFNTFKRRRNLTVQLCSSLNSRYCPKWRSLKFEVPFNACVNVWCNKADNMLSFHGCYRALSLALQG